VDPLDGAFVAIWTNRSQIRHWVNRVLAIRESERFEVVHVNEVLSDLAVPLFEGHAADGTRTAMLSNTRSASLCIAFVGVDANVFASPLDVCPSWKKFIWINPRRARDDGFELLCILAEPIPSNLKLCLREQAAKTLLNNNCFQGKLGMTRFEQRI
jgi:hypothetical protein